jgi:hypothetical protein
MMIVMVMVVMVIMVMMRISMPPFRMRTLINVYIREFWATTS